MDFEIVGEVAPRIANFGYNPADGMSEAALLGQPNTRYKFRRSADLDFASGADIVLSEVTVGTLDGDGVVTDAEGRATVRFNFGTGRRNFLRAEEVDDQG